MSEPDERDIIQWRDVGKIHDLDAPADLARRDWPALIATPFALSHLSRWYIISRYPGDDDPGPTVDEVAAAPPHVDALLSAVTAQAPAVPSVAAETVRGESRGEE